jgi:ubiquinone/menaquinone biosynthesis C-methylase UbiE
MGEFQVGDAQDLPFADLTFDVVASALVLNFILDSQRRLSEMRRVAQPAGMVGGYVGDFWPNSRPASPYARRERICRPTVS